ncbi:glycosyltransferase family 4 protein [Ruegeria faecimaris]|uniref:Glycosyltransferase involved in cell wall bisynthesis n=1 Tax=Ruegeria faecimaris TaxID=686389 RepID=A0A521CQR5_9RHOB|nr:glycosyltransferase family 4 protein [Ruegeria faecimaris]SMO61000.1 Glycosyltransferase involved in cell wall bisynthesis [Ruegeria faecimaris]
MKKIRVLFPFAGWADLGGSHVSALKLASCLDRDQFEPLVLCHNEAGSVGQYAQSLGLNVEVLQGPRLMGPPNNKTDADVGFPEYWTRTYGQLVRFLRDKKPDIVHTNEGRLHVNWVFPARRLGIKHIWHHRQDPRAVGVNYVAPVFSNRILSVSYFSKPSRPIRSVDKKFQVIRSPFDLSIQRPDPDAARRMILNEIGAPENAVLLGYFGHLEPRKRPVHFVQSLVAIQKQFGDRPVHGLLFGKVLNPDDGLDSGSMDVAREQGMGAQIHMMGFRQDVEKCMVAMDATLVPALNEPFGRTLIEAMHLGLPVVATRHGGNVEAIDHGKTGFLVDPQDPEAFVEPVVSLIEGPSLRQQVTQAAYQYVQDNFGLDKHVAEVSDVYRELVS